MDTASVSRLVKDKLGAEVVAIVPEDEKVTYVAWRRFEVKPGGGIGYEYGTHAIGPDGRGLYHGHYDFEDQATAVRDCIDRAGYPALQIAALLDGTEWGPEHLDDIAGILTSAGYTVRDTWEVGLDD